jgi:hypothetical protein
VKISHVDSYNTQQQSSMATTATNNHWQPNKEGHGVARSHGQPQGNGQRSQDEERMNGVAWRGNGMAMTKMELSGRLIVAG